MKSHGGAMENMAAIFACAAGALALLALTGTARAEEPEQPYVRSVQGEGARRVVGRPAGRLLDAALPRTAAGGREVLLLVRPEAPPEPPSTGTAAPPKPDCDELQAAFLPDTTPRQLIRMDLAGEGSFATLREDLPPDAESLAPVDLDGDGADELLIGGRGSVAVMTATGLRPMVSQPDLSLDGSLAALASMPGGAGRLLIPSLHGLSLFAPGAAGEAWASAGNVIIPVEASILEGEIIVHALPLQRVRGAALDAPLLYAAGPREYGSQRLQTLVVHATAAGTDADPLVTESWSLLPEPEEIVESTYLMLDGKVALLAITRPGEKLSITGEKLLRLFVLEPDRSRTGRPPLFAAQSRMNLWQLAHPVLADVNGDGNADLVIGYWKGLKDSTVVLDAYLRGADGKFARSPRTTEFDVEDGDRGMLEYGHDVTGDSLPDLLVRSLDTMVVYSGEASRDGKALVSRAASRSVAGGGMSFSEQDDFDISFGPRQGSEGEGSRMRVRRVTSGDPRFVDLDGDGAAEVVVVNTGAPDECAVHVIRFQGSAPLMAAGAESR